MYKFTNNLVELQQSEPETQLKLSKLGGSNALTWYLQFKTKCRKQKKNDY